MIAIYVTKPVKKTQLHNLFILFRDFFEIFSYNLRLIPLKIATETIEKKSDK